MVDNETGVCSAFNNLLPIPHFPSSLFPKFLPITETKFCQLRKRNIANYGNKILPITKMETILFVIIKYLH